MNYEKIEKAAELVGGLIMDAHSAIDTLTEVRGVLNQILDGNIIIKKEDAEVLLKLVNTRIKNDEDNPMIQGSAKCIYNLKKSLEGAIFG